MPPDDSWLLHRHRIGNKPHALACNVTSSSNLTGGIDTPRGCPCPTWTIKRCVAGAGRKEAVRVAINAHKAANDLPPRIDAIGCRSVGCSIGNIERNYLASCKHKTMAHGGLVRIPITDDNSLRINTKGIGVKRARIIQMSVDAVLVNKSMYRECAIHPHTHDHPLAMYGVCLILNRILEGH